ncbi:YggS family pyridoxal phosphate-dependent enzyme [Saccharopolyspora hattusasensis]|uniref:YggS family pyridoxal phosphate-dependent enzyme n=1 Tax=Saccharopolyspora hattusasensis TaxID=1128679 RepID=UPI003D9897B3
MSRHPSDGLARVTEAIANACARSGRDPGSVELVAASKTVPVEVLTEAIMAGHRVFGENRVQEANGKWPELRAAHPDVELHLIGPLQSNKAGQAVELFDVIHSVDRVSLCAALARQCELKSRWPELFVQVNTGMEAQKAGVAPEDADAFVKSCRQDFGLNVTGLMCIPPPDRPPAPHFELLAGLAERSGLSSMSMGMSGDYELAVEYGATHVRVGSAIFGARPPMGPA